MTRQIFIGGLDGTINTEYRMNVTLLWQYIRCYAEEVALTVRLGEVTVAHLLLCCCSSFGVPYIALPVLHLATLLGAVVFDIQSMCRITRCTRLRYLPMGQQFHGQTELAQTLSTFIKLGTFYRLFQIYVIPSNLYFL